MRQIKVKNTDQLKNRYLEKVLRSLNKYILNPDSNKETEIIVSFYFQDVEDLGGYEVNEIKSVLALLKKEKHIKDFESETGSKDIVNNNNEFNETIYYIKYICRIIPKKFTQYLKELSILPKYYIELDFKKGEQTLILNSKYILAKPHYAGPAYNLFEFVFNNPNKKLTRLFIEKMIGEKDGIKYKFSRRMYGMLNDLNFKNEIKKVFFPRVSEEALYFRNNILINEIKEEKINYKKLEREIKNLRLCVRNSTK